MVMWSRLICTAFGRHTVEAMKISVFCCLVWWTYCDKNGCHYEIDSRLWLDDVLTMIRLSHGCDDVMCVTSIESTVDEGEKCFRRSFCKSSGREQQKRRCADTQAKQTELKALYWNLGLQLAFQTGKRMRQGRGSRSLAGQTQYILLILYVVFAHTKHSNEPFWMARTCNFYAHTVKINWPDPAWSSHWTYAWNPRSIWKTVLELSLDKQDKKRERQNYFVPFHSELKVRRCQDNN